MTSTVVGFQILLSSIVTRPDLFLVTSFLNGLMTQFPSCTFVLTHDFQPLPLPLIDLLKGKVVRVVSGHQVKGLSNDPCALQLVTSDNSTSVKPLIAGKFSPHHWMVVWTVEPATDLLAGDSLDTAKFKLVLISDHEQLLMRTSCIFCSPTEKIINLGSYSEGHRTLNITTLFPDMTGDLKKKKLKALSVFFSIKKRELEDHEKGILLSNNNIFGSDMMYLFIAQGLNFDFEAKEPQLDTVRDGKFVLDLVNGDVDMILHSFMAPSFWHLIDYTYPFLYDFGTFAIARPMTSNKLVAMNTPYSFKIWMLFFLVVVLSLMAISAILYCSRRVNRAVRASNSGQEQSSVCHWSIRYLIRILLEQPIPSPSDRSTRVFLSSWWMAALIVLTVYKSHLFGDLSVPGKPHWHPKTFAQLNQSQNFSFGASERIVAHAAIVFDRSSFDTLYDTFLDKGIYQNSTASCIHAALTSPTFACIDSNKLLSDRASHLVDRNGRSRLWISPDQILYHYVGVAVKKGWVARDSLDRMLGRATNAGLPIKFHRLRRYRHGLLGAARDSNCQECEDREPEPLTRNKLIVSFYILAVGLVIGTICFVAELVGSTTLLDGGNPEPIRAGLARLWLRRRGVEHFIN